MRADLEIDKICDEFEASWKAGKNPRIESFLNRVVPDNRSWLLTELLAVELSLLEAEQREVSISDYLARFPQEHRAVHRAFTMTPLFSPAPTLLGLIETLHRDSPVTDALADLREFATDQVFQAGDYLIRQGEGAKSLMVIRDGIVEIRVTDDDGVAHVIDRSSTGDVLGEMSLLTSEPRTASAIAVGTVRAVVLPADAFHAQARKRPELSLVLTELIADRLGRQSRDALTGKQLDRYRIQRRLGRGGMAVVYRAIDENNQEQVALKMMSHRLIFSSAALKRFQLEADLIQRFDHPNIVKMHSRFRAFRTYFIAMEYCVGQTLESTLAEHGPLDEQQAKRWLGQLVAALKYAHEHGVVHRDVKPANIMCLRDGTLKLMDFGLAEPLDSAKDDGKLVGTPRYMAPEQRRGRAADPVSDFFSVGCVAYEMLVGVPLFQGTTHREIDRDFSQWQPPRFTEIGRPIGGETASIIQPLLTKRAQDRMVEVDAIANWGT